jgi:hypothetical protein
MAEAPMAATAMALASAVADAVADARDASDFQANVVMVILFRIRRLQPHSGHAAILHKKIASSAENSST